MQKKQSVNVLEKKLLAIALIDVLKLWGDEKYKCFLQQSKPGKLTEKWFKRFVTDWGVARTIKDYKNVKEDMRKYLDDSFRKMLSKGNEGNAVDVAAKHIQNKKWGSRIKKNGQGSRPISIVSKVGFFYCPDKLVPLDNFARQGLNKLRRRDNECRIRESYVEYLKAFDEQYDKNKSQLEDALNEQWVKDLAKELGCPDSALKNIAMSRKLLDNYLMELAKKPIIAKRKHQDRL